MADNILDAACQRESPQAAKRMRLDTDHEDGTSVPPSSLDAEGFVDPQHPNKVLEGLNRLRLNSALCDVILCCEEQEVPCHRAVLASFSPYFEAMFTSGMKESTQDRVTISGLEPQMIGLLVNYAYNSKVSISADNVQALLAASDLLEVTAVRDACCDYMRRHMDVNNCVEIYCSADDHSCEMLKRDSMDYILEYFSVIYKQEAFLSLSVETLTKILSSEHLNVPEEDMVFEAAMLWLDKCPTRKQSFGQVLEHIRLSLISPSYLQTVVERLDVVKEQQGCQRFISEAKGECPYSNTIHPRSGRTTVIVTLGETIASKDIDIVESFDPLTNQHKTLGRLPLKKIGGYAVCASGSSLYLAGGQFYDQFDDDDENDLSREMWRYDVHPNSWSRMAPMNEPRILISLVMLDGYVFAVGGRGRKKTKDSMEKYDTITDTWQLIECVGVAAHYDSHACNVVALDGHLYFIGGAPDGWINPTPPHGAKYNPKTSMWTDVAPMQIPRNAWNAAACVLNGKIYVTGGGYFNDSINSMECFNPQTNQWTMCASMRVERYSSSMAVVDGIIYVLGGTDIDGVSPVLNIECYCEETDTWKTVGQMAHATSSYLKCVTLKLRNDHSQPIDDDDDDDDDEDSIDDDSDDSIVVDDDDDDHDDDDHDDDDHDDDYSDDD